MMKALMEGLNKYLKRLGSVTCSRGQQYFESQRVHNLKLEENVITSHVKGTQVQPYLVKIKLGTSGYMGSCSCPMRIDCKHAAATVWAALLKLKFPGNLYTKNLH